MARGSYKGNNPKTTCMGQANNATKTSSMNKNKRSNFKKYRGQGK